MVVVVLVGEVVGVLVVVVVVVVVLVVVVVGSGLPSLKFSYEIENSILVQ